ncbi:MAG: CvpA family protein [bacterium]|nr:CvpA family protein [bacterium]
MVSIIDSIIIILLLLGALVGFKAGVIKSAVSFLGTLLIIFLSFKLKNPISELMYMHLPFFNFSGELAGVSVFNVLIYEGLAFLIVFAVLEVLLKIVVFASGILESILRLTIVFGLFSKILGLIFGFIEYYIIVFAGVFMLNCFSNTAPLVSQSSLATNILNNTPVLTKYFEEPKKAVDEILQLSELYNDDKEAYNKSAFEILIKYNVISKEQATKLLEKDKIKISGAKDILDKYQNN